MSLGNLANAFDFDHITSTGQIKYDIEKLRWINQKWIQKISFEEFKGRIASLLTFPHDTKFEHLLTLIKPELMTLNDVVEKTHFYFQAPDQATLDLPEAEKSLIPFLKESLDIFQDKLAEPEEFVKLLAQKAKAENIPAKPLYALLRRASTGQAQGLSIKDILSLLGKEESYKRLVSLITSCSNPSDSK